MTCSCNATHVYTAKEGKVYKSKLVNETLQGYRVEGGIRVYSHIVYKDKLRIGWKLECQKPFYTERAFLNRNDAESFAVEQVLCMENYYRNELRKIEDLKAALYKPEHSGTEFVI